ncbi:MAG: NAD(+) kinase [Cyanobacteria bacterium SIG32]|nr:NAD(+) kinase [Cyanobacteria bacterium SIG32]
MKNLAIAYNKTIDHSVEVMQELKSVLLVNGVAADIFDIDALKSGYDFVFVIGGDGTILKTARFYAKYSTPIFGINLGRLGFLSQSSKENLTSSVEKILKGEYRVEDRIMLQSGEKIALNDFVVKGTTTGRTSRFSLKINDKFVCDYLADGIIITTPTGSTAYGLSAGGPVISPNLSAFLIVPICPHTLTARPIVIPDDEIITICSDKDLTNYVASTDGQEFYEFAKEITIKKSENVAKLALLDGEEFYSVLRNKLHWGISPACIK